MIYVKVNDVLYPATIEGKMQDRDWDNRSTKAITLEMDFHTALKTWIEGVSWSIINETLIDNIAVDEEGNEIIDEFGNPIVTKSAHYDEYDNSDYNMAAEITDHRDGTVTVRMGKLTELEVAVGILLGGEI